MQEPEQTSLIPESPKELTELTERNWLFIKHYLVTRNVKEAHRLAGYEGRSDAAPYVLFKQLKPKIEELLTLDVTSRARLLSEVSKLLDIPLLPHQEIGVTLKERTKLLELVAKLTPDAIAPKQNLSVFVIKRFDPRTNEGTGQNRVSDTKPIPDSPNVIDVEPIQ